MATVTDRVSAVLDRDGVVVPVLGGAAVTVFFSFLPFSPVAGGAVAAVRYDRGYLAGLGVGTLAGVVAAIPLVALFVPAVWLVSALGYGVDPGSPVYDVFLALVGAMFLGYTVGLSALGGPLGVALDRHTAVRVDLTSWW